MNSEDPSAAIQAIVNQNFDAVQLYLARAPEHRNPLLLPPLVNALDDLIHFLRTVVRGHIPHQAYRNHVQATVAFQDRLSAVQRQFAQPHFPTPPRQAQRSSTESISAETLSLYTNLGLPDRLIALQLGTSRRTITRQRQQLGLTKRILKHSTPEATLQAVSTWSITIFAKVS